MQMNEGRERAHWWHTSSVVATIANANRTKKSKKVYHAKDIHPWEVADRKRRLKDRSKADNKLGFKVLKAAFVDGKSGQQIETEFGG